MTTKTTRSKKLNLATGQDNKAKETSAPTEAKALPAANFNLTPKLTPTSDNFLNLNLTTEGVKSLAIMAASLVFASPAFATQATPQNIVSLADMFYRYAVGNILVNQPSDEAAKENAQAQAANTTVFG